MGLPTEDSIFCEKCGCFNIQGGDCIIIEGLGYCEGCLDSKFGIKKEFEKIRRYILEVKDEAL